MCVQVSVVFTSKSKRVVVDILEAAMSLVAPYEWQGLYIPLLPERMRHGVMDSPFPFVVGWVHQNGITDVMDGVDVREDTLPRIIFNLDNNTIVGAKRKHLFGFTYHECDPDMMPNLPNRHLKKMMFLLRHVKDSRDATWGTMAILEDSDEEKIEFFHKGGRQRIQEIRWAVTSILISLFKNLRQCISVPDASASAASSASSSSPFKQAAGERVLNRDEFVALFPEERQAHIKMILESQNFACFLEDNIISGGGNPFDHWCFTKVESLTHRYVKNKSKAQQGLLWKAKVGTDTQSWKLRFFQIKTNSQVLEYFDVPKEYAAKFNDKKPRATKGGKHNIKKMASGNLLTTKFTPTKESLKGTFDIEEGDSKVIVPRVKESFIPGLLKMLGLKKFKTRFQFQIQNQKGKKDGNTTNKKVLTCCAMTSDDRRRWITCLKSRIVNTDFLDRLRAVYKTRTSHFVDSATAKVRFRS